MHVRGICETAETTAVIKKHTVAEIAGFRKKPRDDLETKRLALFSAKEALFSPQKTCVLSFAWPPGTRACVRMHVCVKGAFVDAPDGVSKSVV